MTPQEYADQNIAQINALNSAFAAYMSAKHALALANQNDEPTDELAETTQAAQNDYLQVENSLRIDSEKALGKGKPNGDFWTIVRSLRQ